MPTGDSFVNLALKRFLSQNRMSENFFEYNQEGRFDGLSRIFPAAGLFTYPVTITPIVGSFDLAPDPIEGIDDEGHVIIVTGNDRLNSVPFENTPGDYYWIGFKYCEIPSGVYNNPRTGIPEYDKIMEEVGEIGEPTSVTDLVGTIRLNCNDIFEASIDHSGREVLVGLKNPMSGDATVALEVCTVAYDAGSGENRIVTAGTLGQVTVSTSVADYFVACLGCTVRKSVLNPFSSHYIIIGNILGHAATPTSNTTGLQLDLSGGGGHTLQKAYDGLAGSGSGRNILAADQAVEITQENDAPNEHDVFNSKLRIVGDTDKALATVPVAAADYEVGLDVKSRFSAFGSIINRTNVADCSGSGYLNNTETITVPAIGNTIDFSRVGVDLTFPALNFALHPGETLEVVEITGSAVGNDGVYLIDAILAGSMDLNLLDGSAASLAQELANPSLTVSVYRLSLKLGEKYTQNTILASMDILRDIAGSTSNCALRVEVPSGSSDIIKTFEAGRLDATGSVIDTGVSAYANGDLRVDNDLTVTEDVGVDNGSVTVTTGNITATAGNIIATAGDFVLNGANGDIEVNGATGSIHVNGATGHIVAAHGNITATAGNIVATAGNITATAGSVSAGNDVTAADDVISTSGDVQASAGNVITKTNFSYIDTQTRVMRYGPEDCNSMYNATKGYDYWEFIPGANPAMQSRDQVDVAAGSFYIPLKLPNGSTVTKITTILDALSSAITVAFVKTTNSHTVPTLGGETVISTANTAGTSLEVVSLSPGNIIDNANRYFIKITASYIAGGDLFYESEVSIEYDNLQINPA